MQNYWLFSLKESFFRLPHAHPFFALPPTLLLNLAKNMMEDEQKRRITCYHYYRYNNTQNKLLYSLKERKTECVPTFLISIELDVIIKGLVIYEVAWTVKVKFQHLKVTLFTFASQHQQHQHGSL